NSTVGIPRSDQMTMLLRDFEEAWHKGNRPALLKRVPPHGQPERGEAVRELACLDLTYRIRHGDEVPLAEWYLQAFPEDLSEPSHQLELITVEYQECRRRGDR